ncbi:Hypothetical predicted protein, partial [Paramuricea clavata]
MDVLLPVDCLLLSHLKLYVLGEFHEVDWDNNCDEYGEFWFENGDIFYVDDTILPYIDALEEYTKYQEENFYTDLPYVKEI